MAIARADRARRPARAGLLGFRGRRLRARVLPVPAHRVLAVEPVPAPRVLVVLAARVPVVAAEALARILA